MIKRPLCLVCAAFVVLVMLLVTLFPPPFYDTTDILGESVDLTGRVIGKEWKNHMLSITIDRVQFGSDKMILESPQGVLCRIGEDLGGQKLLKLGSYVQINGRVQDFPQAGNWGEFDQRNYYRAKGIDFQVENAVIQDNSLNFNARKEFLYEFRQKLEQIYDSVFPKKQAGIMKAMILGTSDDLDPEIKAAYQQSGIAHLLVISGQHISLIGLGLYQLLRKCGLQKYIAAAISLILIVQYATMTGLGNSTQRAVVMFGIFLLADLWNRSYDMITAMALTAVGILFFQPLMVFQAGFLLSFGAVMGIGLLYPTLNSVMQIKNKIFLLFLSSFSISIFTLPIIMFFYSTIPTYSILLNLLVIPFMAFLLVFGILVLPAFLLYPDFAGILSYPSRLILYFYNLVCELNTRIPGNTLITGQPDWIILLLFYAGILAIVILAPRLHKLFSIFFIALILSILFWRPPIPCSITMLDVGQGDCILVEAEEKKFLIDAGSSSKKKVGEYKIIPALKALGINRLDGIFVTHGDQDHISGIFELITFGEESGGIEIASLILPDVQEQEGESCQVLAEAAIDAGIEVRLIGEGDRVETGNLILTCLNPDKTDQLGDLNAASIALFLQYEGFKALFTGDITGEGEANMIEELEKMKGKGEDIKLDYLKVAHHGSNSSTPAELLKLTRPSLALISCGENNAYGHPHVEVIERLEEEKCQIFLTSKTGAISVITDGDRVKVRTHHPQKK